MLIKLSCDDHPIVRQAVAANKKTPRATLRQLCSDVDQRVSKVAEYNMKLREQKKISRSK